MFGWCAMTIIEPLQSVAETVALSQGVPDPLRCVAAPYRGATLQRDAPKAFAELAGKIKKTLNSIGSKAGDDGFIVRAEYRKFFQQRFQELRAAEDDAHRLEMLLSWIFRTPTKRQKVAHQHTLEARTDYPMTSMVGYRVSHMFSENLWRK